MCLCTQHCFNEPTQQVSCPSLRPLTHTSPHPITQSQVCVYTVSTSQKKKTRQGQALCFTQRIKNVWINGGTHKTHLKEKNAQNQINRGCDILLFRGLTMTGISSNILGGGKKDTLCCRTKIQYAVSTLSCQKVNTAKEQSPGSVCVDSKKSSRDFSSSFCQDTDK